MAEYLASIFGTEKDKVNCSFYFKIGACRHGDRCSRQHNRPTYTPTILIQNFYQNPHNIPYLPDGRAGADVPEEEVQRQYEDLYADIFVELESKYGEIEEMNICDNLGDHLIGNVYVKFSSEEVAERAAKDLNNRWYGGKAIVCELSPVTDFQEACCRQYEKSNCDRGGFCNFMHMKPISYDLYRELYGSRPPPSSRVKGLNAPADFGAKGTGGNGGGGGGGGGGGRGGY
eukprot:Opistho-2@52213